MFPGRRYSSTRGLQELPQLSAATQYPRETQNTRTQRVLVCLMALELTTKWPLSPSQILLDAKTEVRIAMHTPQPSER